MKQFVLVASLVIGALTCGEARAQRWYVAPHIGYGGYGYGYGFGGASTPASAAGHAMADMTRSQGMYNAMTSAAMTNLEKARGEYIENQKQWTDVYMMKQRIVEGEQAKRKEEARARNARWQEFQASHPSDLPPRLTSSELDPTTGRIMWPSGLMRDEFADQRRAIEGLFTSRAHTGTTSELSDAIVKQVKAMQDELRKHIRDIVTQEYMDSRKFLDRLSLEGRFPIG
jgi:hypothetical protein